jgi:surfeit locus 1 family protein
MSIRLGNRRFAPTLLGTLAALAGILLFARLGMWQLDRADQKRALQDQLAAGQETTVDLTSDRVDELDRYQRVRVRGRYDAEHQILLDNMPSQHGQPGYRVLTPLEMGDGAWILVDRGWLPWGATRLPLPDVRVDGDERVVTGQIDELPRPGMRLNDTVQSEGPWPRVMNYPRHEDLERALQRKTHARIVLLDPADPDGYDRARNLESLFSTGRHIGYAVQWFALATAVLVVYLLLSSKKEQGPT